MNRQTFFIFSIVVLIFISCSAKTSNYPYEYIDSKTEDNNRMNLYAYSGELDINVLKEFCKSQKQKVNSGTFYFIVIFDNKNNATFPTSPLTASYGMEEEPQKHIRAYYTYNRLNGYSQLDYYDKNKWESVAKSGKI